MTATSAEAYTTTYAYDLNNRLLEEIKSEVDVAYRTDYYYDANGNAISSVPSVIAPSTGDTSALALSAGLDAATLYEYDGSNRQIMVRNGENVTEYTYLANGLPSSVTANGITTAHIWDGSNIIADVVDDTVTAKYLRGIGLIAADFGTARSYYLYNAHGDVTGLTDTSGTVTQKYDYDAFGNEQPLADYPTENDQNPFRYCGEYLDAETGTYYLRARYYSPSIGRFLAEDTHWNPTNMIYGDNPVKWNEREQNEDDLLGLNTYSFVPNLEAIYQSGNLYVYGLNNPLKYKDPSGNIALVDDAAIVLVLATGVVITVTYAWLTSPEGQKAINEGASAIYNGAVIAGKAVTKAAKAAVDGVVAGAQWIGDKASDAWTWFTGLFASGKSNPRDLEKGMSKNQKGHFQREIEDYKKGGGMPPDFNVPWEILVELAEYVRQNYK